MEMKAEKIIKEIGIYILAFVAAYSFLWKVALNLRFIGQAISLLRQYFPSIAQTFFFVLLFLPSFLISVLIIYVFTKNWIKSLLISIAIDILIFVSFALEGLSPG